MAVENTLLRLGMIATAQRSARGTISSIAANTKVHAAARWVLAATTVVMQLACMLCFGWGLAVQHQRCTCTPDAHDTRLVDACVQVEIGKNANSMRYTAVCTGARRAPCAPPPCTRLPWAGTCRRLHKRSPWCVERLSTHHEKKITTLRLAGRGPFCTRRRGAHTAAPCRHAWAYRRR